MIFASASAGVTGGGLRARAHLSAAGKMNRLILKMIREALLRLARPEIERLCWKIFSFLSEIRAPLERVAERVSNSAFLVY